MTAIAYGAKYAETQDLTTTEIAKRLRADVKHAKKAGVLPKALKLSVRTSYFSGGSSIDIEIKAVPDTLRVLNRDRVRFERDNPHSCAGSRGMPILTVAAKRLEETLKGMLDAYNYDGSDTQTDYWCVRFYSNISWSSDVRNADRERALVELAPPTESPKLRLVQ